jgi:hypothetical protein
MSLLGSGGSSGSGKGGVSRVVTLCERFVTLLYTATYQEPLDYSKYCSSSFVDSFHTTFSAQFLARAHVSARALPCQALQPHRGRAAHVAEHPTPRLTGLVVRPPGRRVSAHAAAPH